jgi:hypothetical protein
MVDKSGFSLVNYSVKCLALSMEQTKVCSLVDTMVEMSVARKVFLKVDMMDVCEVLKLVASWGRKLGLQKVWKQVD